MAFTLNDLDVWEVLPGWDTIEGYAIVKGTIMHGERIGVRDGTPRKASDQLEHVRKHVAEWPVVTPGQLMLAEPGDDWDLYLILSEHLGVAVPLLALVESLQPGGEWRWGKEDGSEFVVGGDVGILTRVVNGEVVGMIAPVERLANARLECL